MTVKHSSFAVSRPLRIGWVVCVVFATLMASSGCEKPMLSVDDTVAIEEAESPIRVFVERPTLSEAGGKIKDAEVAIYANGREIHRGKTDKSGHIAIHSLLPDTVNEYEARAVIEGEEVVAKGKVFRWGKGTIVLVDIDETISNTDYDALLSGADTDVSSTPLPQSVEVLNALAKNFSICYLTARPRKLLIKTRRWLESEGFPPGPVLTSDRFKDIVDQRAYKRRVIAHVRKVAPNALVGIGNNIHDAEAYGANGMLTIVLAKDAAEGYKVHGVLVRNWNQIRDFFDANMETLDNPARLRQVLKEGGMLNRPVQPFPRRGAPESQKP